MRTYSKGGKKRESLTGSETSFVEATARSLCYYERCQIIFLLIMKLSKGLHPQDFEATFYKTEQIFIALLFFILVPSWLYHSLTGTNAVF